MYQQHRVNRSVKTVYTNSFAKHHELHKFATTYMYSNFKTIDSPRHAISHNVHVYQISAKSGY